MSLVGVVSALKLEARTLGSPTRQSNGLFALRDGTLIAVSGIGGAAAASSARALVDAGAAALISWGLAGGLDPALRAGTICLPSSVVSRDGDCVPTDPDWRGTLIAALSARCIVVGGRLLTSAIPVDDVAGKASAFRNTGAVAVDMESLDIAKVAATHGVPFIAVRVIVDTAADTLPTAVLNASFGGRVQLSRLLLGVLRAPRAIAPLFKLANRYRTATRALVAVARTGALRPLRLTAARPTRIA